LEEVDELELPTHYHRKTRVTALVNGTGEYFLNILPKNQSIDRKCFAEESVGGPEKIYYPERRNPRERTIALHSDSAPIHNTRTVMGQLEQSRFNRREILANYGIWPRVASFLSIT
jgi:hypothetical protein